MTRETIFVGLAALAACVSDPELGGLPAGGGDPGAAIDPAATATEQCGNALDDDGDGRADDDCPCDEIGAIRACYTGPLDTRGVGTCRDGVQTCDGQLEFPVWGSCEGAAGPAADIEGNGIDEDCDGADGADRPALPDGAGEASPPVCGPDGDGTEVYRFHAPEGGLGESECNDLMLACAGGDVESCNQFVEGCSAVFGSGVREGDGGPAMEVSCEPGICDEGLVGVEKVDRLAGASIVECVEPPPDCADGTYATWRRQVEGDPEYLGDRGVDGNVGQFSDYAWHCDPPCDVVVRYGGLYGNEEVCAPPPDGDCPAGQVPTFVAEDETWQCRPTCDNGLYDQVDYEGRTVCVPC